jgi:hypothetical protein
MSIIEQITIANQIREHLASMQVEDEGLIHDTLEGECDIFQCGEWLLKRIAKEDSDMDSLDAYIAKLKARKERIETRKERWRELLAMVIAATGEKSLKTPFGTATLAQKPIGIATIDESLVPDSYFITETIRKLDKAKLKSDALASGVVGVVLDNGGVSLRIKI